MTMLSTEQICEGVHYLNDKRVPVAFCFVMGRVVGKLHLKRRWGLAARIFASQGSPGPLISGLLHVRLHFRTQAVVAQDVLRERDPHLEPGCQLDGITLDLRASTKIAPSLTLQVTLVRILDEAPRDVLAMKQKTSRCQFVRARREQSISQ